jgi:opacity protein-like surface antigen
MTWRRSAWHGTLGAALAAALLAAPVRGQDLADFDYENLRFRGFAPEWGYLWPTRVEPTQSWGVRLDLGYLGPGLRIVPSVTHWQSTFKAAEVRELEERVASLISTQIDEPAPTVDLGVIDWSDIALAVDAHLVWRVPYGVLTFAGLGTAVHMLDGSGTAVDGTFVEDLLDSVTAGFNAHAGVEYPVARRFRVYGQVRYEVLGDLRYSQLRFGGQFMIGSAAPGEERAP